MRIRSVRVHLRTADCRAGRACRRAAVAVRVTQRAKLTLTAFRNTCGARECLYREWGTATARARAGRTATLTVRKPMPPGSYRLILSAAGRHGKDTAARTLTVPRR